MILVTGGTGFVGRHLVSRLMEMEERVRVLARAGDDLPGVEIIHGDVRDLSAVVGAARGCRAVIHLVGIIARAEGRAFAPCTSTPPAPWCAPAKRPASSGCST